MSHSQEMLKCTRTPVPLKLGPDRQKNMIVPMTFLLETTVNQFSFDQSQTWEFDVNSIGKIVSRYTSAHADSFKYINSFSGKTADP